MKSVGYMLLFTPIILLPSLYFLTPILFSISVGER